MNIAHCITSSSRTIPASLVRTWPELTRQCPLRTLSVAGYQRMVARIGVAAGFPFLVHSHMLRHSCGYKLANDGQDTRAIQHTSVHKSINSTVRYTALAPNRFKNFWKD